MFDQVLDYRSRCSAGLIASPDRACVKLASRRANASWAAGTSSAPLSQGPEEQIEAEAKDALAQTGGRRFILANGCSVPDDTDHRWLGSPGRCRGASGRLSRRQSSAAAPASAFSASP